VKICGVNQQAYPVEGALVTKKQQKAETTNGTTFIDYGTTGQ